MAASWWVCAAVGFCCFCSVVQASIREYHVGVVEEAWDYAPGVGDLTADDSQRSKWSMFLQQGPDRIGRTYMKAMYREFTNDTFTEQNAQSHPNWLGLLGPIIAGEEGDVIRVTFKNMAVLSGRNFSIHPNGLQFSNEGGVYEDMTSRAYRTDEGLPPGQVHTYEWKVTDTASPTADDPDCLTWTYQSRVHVDKDLNSGLVGILLTCKPGTLATMHQRYHKRFALLVNVFDENESWYIEHNIRNFIVPALPSPAVRTLKANAGFKASNVMQGVNGQLLEHLQGLHLCVGSPSLWHLAAMETTEVSLHSLSVAGHSFLVNSHRVGSVGMSSVDFVTAELEVQTAGRWPMVCNIREHADNGMVAVLTAEECGDSNRPSIVSQIQRFRTFYVAIEEDDWNYAPGGRNLFDGEHLLQPGSPSAQYFRKNQSRAGGVYRKAMFRAYTDITFSERRTIGDDERHLGFLGPVLRVETGDAVALTLNNKAMRRAFSIYPHGAQMVTMGRGPVSNRSSASPFESEDDLVAPGQVRTRYWFIPDVMGPGPRDPPCVTRLYTSSSRDSARDAHSGLVGPILVCRKGALNKHDRQRQVDREFFLMVSATDENLSWYNDTNLGYLQVDTSSDDFYQSNLMHGINGYLYGNLPGLSMCVGDRVAWHVLSQGSEQHVHTMYFHGQPLTVLDTHRSSVHVLPGSSQSVLMKADNPGQWAVLCQTSDHYRAGQKALFEVNQCDLRRDFSLQFQAGRNRIYFLQAEEEYWDYAPQARNRNGGDGRAASDHLFTRNDGPYLGTKYMKVRFHQYEDDSFAPEVEVHRNEKDGFLGVLGPVITAEAYDVITVVFKNNASRPYSVHAQGVFYDKASEGAPYGGSGEAVPPGETTVYEWSVPADFAPAEGDPDCITKAYYSAVDPVKDQYSGLIGPLVICRPGTLDTETGQRGDVDMAFPLLFQVLDENQSWYIDENIRQFGSSQSAMDHLFKESNMMHSVNGFVYGYNPPLTMPQYSIVDWHLMTLGSHIDLHAVHFHGNQILMYETGQHARDVVHLFPGAFVTVRMNATMAGHWLLHCHVHDHLVSGMASMYEVKAPLPEFTFGRPIYDFQ